MPNINLIAARRDEKRQVTVLSQRLFMGFVVSVAVLVVVCLFVSGERIQKSLQIKQLDKDLADQQPKLDRIAEREKDISLLQPKVATLDNARVSTLRWWALMGVVADSLPNTVWITGMSTNGDISATNVSLQGVGPSQAIVGEVARNLDQKGVFTHVDLVSTSNGSAPEDPVQKITFELSAALRPAVLSAAPATPASTSTEPQKAAMGSSENTTTAASAVKP